MSLIGQLVKYSKKTYENGFVSATDGNLSIRLDENKIAITRSGVNKGEVTQNDILIIDNFGNILEGTGKPSTEFKMHLLAYQSRNDINAVVHCHPVYATAFATAQHDLTTPVFPEVVLSIGPVPLCEYATPSTDEVTDSMRPHIQDSWAMLLQNHGAVTFGEDISSAYNRMEKLEHSAKTLFIAKLIGSESVLNDSQVAKLYSLADAVYGIKTQKIKSPFKNTNIDEIDNVNDFSSKSIIEVIEARLRARAGNLKLR